MRRSCFVVLTLLAAAGLLVRPLAAQTADESRYALMDGVSLLDPQVTIDAQEARPEPVPEPVRAPGRRRFFNGLSDNNTLQFARATARIPLGIFGAGVAYSWYSRKTSYPGFFEARQRQAEWRAFGNVTVLFR